jgi:hypothetical protein
MKYFEEETEETTFSDYLLLKNMLTNSPDRVKLDLVAWDLGIEEAIQFIISQDKSNGDVNTNVKQLETAIKDLIVNSWVDEVNEVLPIFPKIITDDAIFWLYAYEVGRYRVDEEDGKMKLHVYLLFHATSNE